MTLKLFQKITFRCPSLQKACLETRALKIPQGIRPLGGLTGVDTGVILRSGRVNDRDSWLHVSLSITWFKYEKNRISIFLFKSSTLISKGAFCNDWHKY